MSTIVNRAMVLAGETNLTINGTDDDKNATECGEIYKEIPFSLFVFSCVCFVPTIYTLLACIGYGIRKSIAARHRMTKTIINVKFDGNSKFILLLLISIQLACIARLVGSVFFNQVYYQHTAIFNIVTGIAYHVISLILWMRQRHIYQKPGIRRMATTTVKFFSFFALFCICISVLSIIINESIFSTKENCDDLIKRTHKLIWIIMLVFDVIFQIILFALFAHPLLVHKRQMKIAKISSFRTLRPAILKILCAAVVCFIANLVIGLTLALMENTRGVGTPASCVSLLLQTVAIVAAYSDWRIRIFPFMSCSTNGSLIFPQTTTVSGRHSQTDTVS